MIVIYIALHACVALLAVCALLLCNILRRANEISEYGMRLAYGLTQISRQQHERGEEIVHNQREHILALNSLSDGLLSFEKVVSGALCEMAANSKPDSPDEADERSEEAKAAEKAFTEGVLNVLNYGGAPGKEGKG